jgi:hypothetical protein
MNTILCSSILVLSSFVALGTPVFSESFSYPDGALLGQGTPAWTITGTSTVNPLQVSSGAVDIKNTGQDAYRAFDSAVTAVDGTSFYYGLTLNVSAASATGDYFVHTTPTVGEASSFYSRLFAQASATGYVLGYLETAGGGAAVTYGTTVLDFNTSYNVSVAYDFVAGALNDTARVYVNPTSTTELDNTPYLSDTWTSTSAEPTGFAAFNIRQGSSSSGPTLTVDNIVASTSFADVAQVPEPSSVALLGLGGVLAFFGNRLRKS